MRQESIHGVPTFDQRIKDSRVARAANIEQYQAALRARLESPNGLSEQSALGIEPLSGTEPISPRVSRAGLVLTFVGGIGLLAAACGGGAGSEEVSPIRPAETSPTRGEPKVTDVRSVALAAISAFLKGDEKEFASYIRPDELSQFTGFGSSFGFSYASLSGCRIEGSKVLVQDQGPVQGTRVILVFSTPCGYNASLEKSYKTCSLNLIRLSDRWYLNYVTQPSCGF